QLRANVKPGLRRAGALRSGPGPAPTERLPAGMAENKNRAATMSAESRESRLESQTKPLPTTNPLLVLISAPSGGGKTTICQQLLAARPQMTRAVTCTTRPMRAGARDGAGYFVLDAESFLKRVQAANFLAHATDHGNS